MPGIGVVMNPHARGNRRHEGRTDRLAAIVGDSGVVRETEDFTQVDEVAHEFRERRIDILAVCGGDGSLFRALTAMVPAYGDEPLPPLLPLRAGTINFVAASIGCRRGDPEHVLAHVVRDYRRGRTHDVTERDSLRVNEVQYGFVIGCGAVVNYLRAYYNGKRAGPLAAAGLLGRVVVSALLGGSLARGIVQPVEADVVCDGERVPFRVFTVMLAGTVEQVALGFTPLYLANRKRGYFQLVAGPIGAGGFLRRLVRLYRGFPTELAELYDNLAREAEIRFARPTHYMIDGDLLAPVDALHVTVGPRLTMIRG
jgi:diacylglycerol kinase family enzyme